MGRASTETCSNCAAAALRTTSGLGYILGYKLRYVRAMHRAESSRQATATMRVETRGTARRRARLPKLRRSFAPGAPSQRSQPHVAWTARGHFGEARGQRWHMRACAPPPHAPPHTASAQAQARRPLSRVPLRQGVRVSASAALATAAGASDTDRPGRVTQARDTGARPGGWGGRLGAASTGAGDASERRRDKRGGLSALAR
eukprot:6187618-Pleurochrysis_carterae.AAC.3